MNHHFHYSKLKYILFVLLFIGNIGVSKAQVLPMKGITLVAPPKPIGQPEMDALKEVNTEWIALVPFGFSSGTDNPKIRYNLDRQWWGERKEGIVECISLAHKNNIKVMLKPQVYIHGSWVGDVTFNKEKDWQEWEKAYSEYIHFYGRLAADNDVELFCIGTEYKKAIQKRPQFWRQLIEDIRCYYPGKLIYSSNWDGYDKVPIWDALDYIGISSYFPLTNEQTPSASTLDKKWEPIKKKLKKFSKKHNKPLVFTEYGYLSIDHCAWRAWELEKGVKRKPINETAQANAYDAILRNFMNEDWWGGGFLWKWFPNGMGHEGYPERDYTPQGKMSEDVIRRWYGIEK